MNLIWHGGYVASMLQLESINVLLALVTRKVYGKNIPVKNSEAVSAHVLQPDHKYTQTTNCGTFKFLRQF